MRPRRPRLNPRQPADLTGGEGLGEAISELQELAERLRQDCPWDRVQTVGTIVPHTVEEAYEVADAAQAGDDEKLAGELGDLLFQVVFLSLLLEERGAGDLAAVTRGLHAKLVRRHPHVFAADSLDSPGAVKARWEELKANQEGREGIFHDLPENLPALVYARKVQRRAANTGFDYPDLAATLVDLDEELKELRDELAGVPEPDPETEPDPALAAELGDVLFSCVNVARRLNVDPELELRAASRRFVDRVEEAERLAAAEGRSFDELPLAEQDRLFDLAKEADPR
ncbi:MAG TPA: nucleoside triphosphate pyrophosphohydrolase [Gaiellaceae bacterium]|nr:nucleoside triphosphate pyrophosphohydrolase [Gaiellaceae bacterium]